MSMFQLPEFNSLPAPELLSEVVNEVWAEMYDAVDHAGAAVQHKYGELALGDVPKAESLPEGVTPITEAPSYQSKMEHVSNGFIVAAADQDRRDGDNLAEIRRNVAEQFPQQQNPHDYRRAA